VATVAAEEEEEEEGEEDSTAVEASLMATPCQVRR
jgi:hypothetical protein